MINILAEQAYKSAKRRGFTINKISTYFKIQEELLEFQKSVKTEKFSKDSEQSEIADIILTICTYSHSQGYNLDKALKEKMLYNEKRSSE